MKRTRSTLWLWAALLPVARAAQPAGFTFPATGVTVERQAILLAIDDHLIPLREHVCLYLSTPSLRREPVVSPSKDDPYAPDQVTADMYGSVIYDGGKYRMWYNGSRLKVPGDAHRPIVSDLVQGPVCYAESPDGVHWTKPVLRQWAIRGRKENNAIRIAGYNGENEAAFVIKDERDPDPGRRYKMVFNPKGRDGDTWVARIAFSSDGLHWTAGEDASEEFIEPAGFYFFNGLYVIDGHRPTPNADGYPSGRQGKAILSPDCDHWVSGDVQAFLLPEPAAPSDRGGHKPYDQVHLGVGAASFGNVVIGFFGRWRNYPGAEIPGQRWSWFPYGRTYADLALLVSDDGLHFREPIKGRNFISHLDTPATPVPGKHFPTILTQSGNGILDVADKTLIYFGRWLNAEYNQGISAEIALATLPRDRWGSLGLYARDEPYYQKRGSVWSAAVRLPRAPCQIFLNADVASAMTVEIADADFQLLPDYSAERCGRAAAAGGLDCGVAWPKGDLDALAGRTVRLKINFSAEGGSNPRLYAVYLR